MKPGATKYPYEYPPDAVIGTDTSLGTFGQRAALAVLVAAIADLALFGFPKTVIPFNYPFFVDVVLLVSTIELLRFTYRTLWNVVTELTSIMEYNKDDPLARTSNSDPDDVYVELSNVLFLAYHPGVLLAGALVGGVFVFVIMAYLQVFSAYPYRILNFGFGAAHGVFFGPIAGGLYVLYRGYSEYIIDINLLDPDGVGGYREIGNGIVRLATYGIFFVTLDFVILSSVTFTKLTQFKLVVFALYFLVLFAFVTGTVVTTYAIRQKLIEIRDDKIVAMQSMFNRAENSFWLKCQEDEDNLADAINILTMYAMFHQMNRMSMWPINLYSLTRLGVSVTISVGVFLVKNFGLIPSLKV